ncbi:MAG: hypothetical protein NBV61_02585 [Algoriphagus sp.]|nr:hypothetical protein [Algoriphagus sp.]
MNTSYSNEALRSDYALGLSSLIGGKLTFQKKWEVQTGYRLFANAISSDFWEPDPATGQANRYESGLFNLVEPNDRFFGRLELLSLAWIQPKFGVKVGKMGIQSDWINAQDGRLSPTVVEGIHAYYVPKANWKVSAWGITRMTIRGSKDWLPIEETIGLYPQGRSYSGKSSAYFGNTSSSWLGIWELEGKVKGGKMLRFSQTFAANLFSTYWATFEKTTKINLGNWTSGIQGGFQHGLREGGNPIIEKQYKNPKDLNFVVSAKLNWKKDAWEAQLSATQLGGKGRWLNPREWGKDAWYTFIPRERNEGFEKVTAVVGYASYRFKKLPLQLYTYMGIHVLPQLEDTAANKYNFPSYRQHTIGLRYAPKKFKNLEFQLIGVAKEPLTTKKLLPIQQYNKVDLWHFNGLINWKFAKD